MAQQIEKLAHFVAETTLEQVPTGVQRYAKLVVLDTIGVVLAGAERPGAGAARALERDRRNGRHGVRAGLAHHRPTNSRPAERHRRTIDRAR